MGKRGKRRVAIILSAILVLGLMNVTGPRNFFGGGDKVAKAAPSSNAILIDPSANGSGYEKKTEAGVRDYIEITASGSYYLDQDLGIPIKINVSAGNVELDLNHHNIDINNYSFDSGALDAAITYSGPPSSVFYLFDGSTLGPGSITNFGAINKTTYGVKIISADCNVYVDSVKIDGYNGEKVVGVGVESDNVEVYLYHYFRNCSIQDCKCGVKLSGNGDSLKMSEGISMCSSTISFSTDNPNYSCVELAGDDSSFTMRGDSYITFGNIGTYSTGDNLSGVKMTGERSSFRMEGGTLTCSGTYNSHAGVRGVENNSNFTMTGGTLVGPGGSNGGSHGISMTGANSSVSLEGNCEIKDFPEAVSLSGGASVINTFTMAENAGIKDCGIGVGTANGSKTVNIAGGKIYSTTGTGNGVSMIGTGNSFSMSGGEISGVSEGFMTDGTGAGTFDMSAGKITGCTDCGVNQGGFNITLSGSARINNQGDDGNGQGGRKPDIIGNSGLFSHAYAFNGVNYVNSATGEYFHVRSEDALSATYHLPVGPNDYRTDETDYYYDVNNNPTHNTNSRNIFFWWEPQQPAPVYYPDPDPAPVSTPTPTPTATATPTPTPTATPINEPDDKGDKFGMLLFRVVKRTKTTLKLKWHKLPDADGYDLYGNQCNEEGKKREVKYIETYGKKTTSVIRRKLKKGKYYKYKLVAFKKVKGKKVPIVSSVHVHATTLGTDENTVAKIVKTYVVDGETKTLIKKKLTIKKGDTIQLEFEEIPEEKDKEIKPHRKVKYESQDPKTVKANKSTGVINGLKKGKAVIYVYAQNGIYDKITVKVT